MLFLAFSVPALRVGTPAPRLTARATISMADEKRVYVPKDAKGKTPMIPKGPFGGYAEPGNSQEVGIVGDKSRSKQIAKFELAQEALLLPASPLCLFHFLHQLLIRFHLLVRRLLFLCASAFVHLRRLLSSTSATTSSTSPPPPLPAYLFFQGPAPKTAIQEDLPSFFSPVRARVHPWPKNKA